MTSKTSDLDGKTELSIMADSGLEKERELTRGTCIDRYVILDKIGEGGIFDPDNPHDYSNCIMPAGSGHVRELMPATLYCDSCLEHINPDNVRSAFP
jgi:hypothetical protein